MDEQSTMDFEEGAVADRVAELCRRGLERFRDGDVSAALLDWNRARALDPEASQPRVYIARAAQGLDPESGDVPAGLALPLGAPPEGESGEAPAATVGVSESPFDEEEEDYLELELTSPGDEPELTPNTIDFARQSFMEAAFELFDLDGVDAGWTLEDEVGRALPPPPREVRAPSEAELASVPASIMGVPDDALDDDDPSEPDLDDLPVPDPPRLGGETLDMPASSDEYRELATRELQPSTDIDLAAVGDVGEPELPPAAAEFDALAAPATDPLGESPVLDLDDLAERATRELESAPLVTSINERPTVEYDSDALDLGLGPAGAADLDRDGEATVPGGSTGEIAAGLGLSVEALEALAGEDSGSIAREDTTVERPGVVKRGLALPDLDGLFGDPARDDDRHDEPSAELDLHFREGAEDSLDHELTTERSSFYSRELTTEQGGPGDDDLTTERPSIPDLGMPSLDDEQTSELEAAALRSPAVIVEPGLVEDDAPGVIHDRAAPGAPELVDIRPGSGNWERACDQLRDQVAGALPPADSADERVGHWVSAFIERARFELDRGNSALAVTALELALDEQPDSIVAQKLIHRHRGLLVDVFQSYLGDGSSVPYLAVPMHELQAETLDSRAVFLLSRIDGTFTVEEILDVAGMGEIEAYRHLSKLALKGILSLR